MLDWAINKIKVAFVTASNEEVNLAEYVLTVEKCMTLNYISDSLHAFDDGTKVTESCYAGLDGLLPIMDYCG